MTQTQKLVLTLYRQSLGLILNLLRLTYPAVKGTASSSGIISLRSSIDLGYKINRDRVTLFKRARQGDYLEGIVDEEKVKIQMAPELK